MKKFIFLISILSIINNVSAQTLNVEPVDNSTFRGKAMFGYQGWFGHPKDNSPRPNYWHWGNMDQIGIGPLEVEMYPDLREFSASERYPTAYTFANGDVAPVFSAGNKETVMRQMRWVRDYNTDGVFVQRFISEYGDRVVMAFRDSTTVAVMKGCETYGRVFAIMYDGVGNSVERIKTDWMHLVDDLEVTSSDRYLHHDGRPLVSLWGFTFYDNATVDQLEALIDWFHNTAPAKYQASIKLGLNDNWFNLDQKWKDAFAKVEVISPWSVGRYSNQSGYNTYLQKQIIPGKTWCTSRGILYVPVLFPGFSWHNLKEGEPKNQIPRLGGNFFWLQAYGAINNKMESLYFAMLDELDEATAFFKTAENSEQAPAQEYWLNLDADGTQLPSDWYLRCAGKATAVLRGNKPNTTFLGIPDKGIMTIRVSDMDCKFSFIFPDFKDESTLEFSLDGGITFPYSVEDNAGSYEISNLKKGSYNIMARHPGKEAVPMGISSISKGCPGTASIDPLDNSKMKDINLYPNPANSIIKIEGMTGTFQIKIFNMIGSLCKLKNLQGPDSQIDISDLPNGVYLISIENQVNKYTKRWIKK